MKISYFFWYNLNIMIFHNIPYRKKLLLSFIGFSLLIIFIIGIFIVFIIEKKHSDKTMITAEKLYHQKLSSLKSYIGEIEGKLFALKNSKFFIDYLHDMNEKNLKMAEEAFFNIAHCSSQIMQLRYIDTYGIERIRVDRNASNSSPYLVPRDQLQTKKNRYYFTQISQTPDNLVWYSNIDLNIEHGEVEKPIKPVLRVGLSHYENNTLQGILIVNIFMKDFLDTLVFSNEYDIYLIDKGDNILVSTDNSHNWSKYINLDKLTARNVKFSDLNLEVPIYSNTLDFNNGEALKIIIKPKNTSLIQALTEETKYILLLLILVFILSFPLAYFFSKYPAKLEKELEEYNNYLEIRVNKAIDLYKENEKMLFHQHRLAQMGEMISMIAHQWRQPLTTIMALVS